MKTRVILSMVFLSVLLLSQENPILIVKDIQICSFVEDRQPIESDTSFTNEVGQLYCFTKLSSNLDSTTISHVWYYKNKEVTNVELKMKAQSWRTWSSKKIAADLIGDWRVDVLSSTGEVLASKKFIVKELTE